MIKRLTNVYGSVAKRIFETGFKITGGTALIGSQGTTPEGLTGSRFIGSSLYGCDHHVRADGDYTIPVLYIDGDIKDSTGHIRGASFTGCNLRGYANDSVVIDHADDTSFVNCTTEFPALADVPNANTAGGFVGTANTQDTRFVSVAGTSDNRLPEFARTVKGNVQIIGAGSTGASGMYSGIQGHGVNLTGTTQTSRIHFTDNIATVKSGMAIEVDKNASMLSFKDSNNRTIGSISNKGGLGSGLMGVNEVTKTIDTDGIDISNTSGQLIALASEDGLSDNLNTISDANTYIGKIVFLRPALASVPITVKTSGGNIRCKTDFVMDNSMDIMQLMYVGGFWLEVSRSDNK